VARQWNRKSLGNPIYSLTGMLEASVNHLQCRPGSLVLDIAKWHIHIPDERLREKLHGKGKCRMDSLN